MAIGWVANSAAKIHINVLPLSASGAREVLGANELGTAQGDVACFGAAESSGFATRLLTAHKKSVELFDTE